MSALKPAAGFVQLSLADCQARAGGPPSVEMAVHVVRELARTSAEGHDPRPLSAQVRLGDDGSVAVAEPRVVDAAALARLLWELLAGVILRAGEFPPAPFDVRAENSSVPGAVADVLASVFTQGERQSVAAFDAALIRACASSGVANVGAKDVARWVASCAPRVARSSPREVPELDFPTSSGAIATRRTSLQAAPPSATMPKAAPPKAEDEDDFDLEIERNAVMSTTSPGSRLSTTQRIGRSGLTLDQAPVGTRVAAHDDSDEPSFRTKAVAFAALSLVTAVAAAALFTFAHRPGGRVLTSIVPHAYDGTSAADSGAVAIAMLALAIVLMFFGLRSRPHAWLIVASGGAALLVALAMVTVTLASSDDHPTPPDGVLLVAYLAPAAILLFALGLGARAVRLLSYGHGKRRLGAVPLAAMAGVLFFVAFEVSWLAR